MIEVNVYSDIANKKEGIWLSMFGLENAVFSADLVKKVFSDNKNEKEFKFNIHCDGGSVSEGLAIYDIMRTSGKTIFCNVEGSCHSMSIILLLAAPAENRTANFNARALIHRVRAFPYDAMTANEAKELAKIIEQEEERLLDIYEDRTGKNRAALRALMNAEKERTASELLDLNFISSINSYNTNFNYPKKMTVRKNAKNGKGTNQKADTLLGKIANFFAKTVNYDYTDSEGNVLFSTEAEEDTLAEGDTVTIPDGSTDGTFELPDGRVVTIVDNVVTEIVEDGGGDEETENLRAENEELRNMLQEAQTVITELRNQQGSSYTPAGRTTSPKKNAATKSKEDLKAEATEKRKQFNAKK